MSRHRHFTFRSTKRVRNSIPFVGAAIVALGPNAIEGSAKNCLLILLQLILRLFLGSLSALVKETSHFRPVQMCRSGKWRELIGKF